MAVSIISLGFAEALTFPEGTSTPPETCGECHQAIFREFAFGFGSDIRYQPTSLPNKEKVKLALPANVSATATAHAFAGVEPFPIHARESEEGGRSCNVCHFPEPSLGAQHCNDCHMPRTVRKVAEDFENPERAVARHLWTGGRSKQRLASALSIAISQPDEKKSNLALHIINIGAGHSVPTGSNRRAVYLNTEILNKDGKQIEQKEWLFAPWYGPRPDDRKYLEEDKSRPDSIACGCVDRSCKSCLGRASAHKR